MRSFFFSRDMYGVALARALNLLFAFVQKTFDMSIEIKFVINFDA